MCFAIGADMACPRRSLWITFFALTCVASVPKAARACVGTEAACSGHSPKEPCSGTQGFGTCERTGCAEAPALTCRPLDACGDDRRLVRDACAGRDVGSRCSLDGGMPSSVVDSADSGAEAGAEAGPERNVAPVTAGTCVRVSCEGISILACYDPQPADRAGLEAAASGTDATPHTQANTTGSCTVTPGSPGLQAASSFLLAVAGVALSIRRRRFRRDGAPSERRSRRLGCARASDDSR